MPERTGPLLTALAMAALVLVSSLHVPVARLLRYATVAPAESLGRAALFSSIAIFLAIGHERLVRGAFYGRLRAKVTPGLAAPLAAGVGALSPLLVRLFLLPRPSAPLWVLAIHGFLTEFLIGLGLCWLVLGTGDWGGSWLASGLALGLVFASRLLLDVTFHGGVVPVLEMLAAGLSALAVAGVLAGPLAPHRDAVMEA